MINMMHKIVKISIPLFAIGMHAFRQSFLNEVIFSDKEQDGAVGDNFPCITKALGQNRQMWPRGRVAVIQKGGSSTPNT